MLATWICIVLAIFAVSDAQKEKPPENADCSLVRCASPDCLPGYRPMTLDGECCPSCQKCPPSLLPCPLILCESITYRDPCGCPECTLATPPETETTPTPSTEETVIPERVCEISGQVYTTCGTACPPVCGEPGQLFCTLQCVVGCQCPSGTFLDSTARQCVTECPTTTSPPTTETPELCSLEPDIGPCRGSMRRYHFSATSRRCEVFIYGGCGGNDNNFETLEICQQTCGTSQVSGTPTTENSLPTGTTASHPTRPTGSQPTKPTTGGTSSRPTRPTGPTRPTSSQPSKPTTGGTGSKPTKPTGLTGETPTMPTRPGTDSQLTRPTGTRPTRPTGGTGSRPTRPTGGTSSRPTGPTRPTGGTASQPTRPTSERPTTGGVVPTKPSSTGSTPTKPTAGVTVPPGSKPTGGGAGSKLTGGGAGSKPTGGGAGSKLTGGGAGSKPTGGGAGSTPPGNRPTESETTPTANAICTLRRDRGSPCANGPIDGSMRRFYYNSRRNTCKAFSFRGCGGNANRFESRQECKNTCM
ncbi:Kunitz-type serine protease inhibitor DrKIn-I [Geodia barretti]|uniref:Kunitz-type serine protease inhibitor DrKIn-I n=1 Tax=Geodia barretti TaxID=519541 RepID=A0AA35T201_GEOBA|nr:Kunitz-type serine protease inhibitor DrKIn-I [Geodia barretti]